MQLLLLFIIIYALKLAPRYLMYKKSNYKNATGNSFKKLIFNAGDIGEFMIFRRLEMLYDNALIISNLYIPKTDNTTTEIDLLLIDKTGIYVFESKNYSGWIYGDESQKNWTQTFKNKQKYKFYNPIWQNSGHITALKNVLNIKSDDVFISYIVFSNKCELKKIKTKSDKIRVLKHDKLTKQLKSDIEYLENIFDDETLNNIHTELSKYSSVSNDIKLKHIQNIKNKHSVSK